MLIEIELKMIVTEVKNEEMNTNSILNLTMKGDKYSNAEIFFTEHILVLLIRNNF